MKIAIVIPAQEVNKYHAKGDLAPFGDTTLLEWKISQCLESFNASDIFVTTDSLQAQSVAKLNNINAFIRGINVDYEDMVFDVVKKIDADYILWVNPTSPFISGAEYKNMIENFKSNLDKYNSLVTTSEKSDFVYYDNQQLNFSKHAKGRSGTTPVYLATNGAYINSKSNILKNKELIGDNPLFYNLNFLESLEVKDVQTYSILKELISFYFIRELDA